MDEALASHDKAIALKPDYADAYYNRGVVLERLQRLEEAISSHDQAIGVHPDHADAHLNKSLLRLLTGDFSNGWRDYEWRKKRDEPAGARSFLQPLWLGEEDLAGKRLFVHWEQGFGDTLQFCRYALAVQARGARVILSVQDPLVRLLRGLDPGIEVIGSAETPQSFDYHCPLMSLPLAVGTTLETIPARTPYLSAAPARTAAWSTRLTAVTGLKVGLVWAGDPRPHDPAASAIDRRRSIALERLAPLLAEPGVSFFSLQKGSPAGQLADIPAELRPLDFMDEAGDFADTAALIANLDLVITVDTAVAHLAGALGKPVWILSRFAGCWRWLLEREDSPWYPTARLFRQAEPGDWDPVIAKVATRLAEVAAGRLELVWPLVEPMA